jgi:hypothetical protein
VVDHLASSAIVLDRSIQIRRVTLDAVAQQWAEWQYTVRREKMTFNGTRAAAAAAAAIADALG